MKGRRAHRLDPDDPDRGLQRLGFGRSTAPPPPPDLTERAVLLYEPTAADQGRGRVAEAELAAPIV
jgi:hypothetical protein